MPAPSRRTELSAEIRSRVAKYFDAKSRSSLRKWLVQLGSKRPAWFFGGFPRDVLLARGSVRDIDIVVDGQLSQPFEWPGIYTARRTRFGGYKIYVPNGMVDIWPVQATWAYVSGGYAGFHDAINLVNTTFFNVEAIVVDLRVLRSSNDDCVHMSDQFIDAVHSRVLDINYYPNPSHALCAVRALALASKLEFDMSRELAAFVASQIARASDDELELVQRSHYGYQVIPTDLLRLSELTLVKQGVRKTLEVFRRYPASRREEPLPI